MYSSTRHYTAGMILLLVARPPLQPRAVQAAYIAAPGNHTVKYGHHCRRPL